MRSQRKADWNLTRAQVDIWNIEVCHADDEWSTWLSTDELAKAARFRLERDRRRYIVAHASLRLLLSQYLGAVPKAIEFNYNSNGKPEIAGPHANSNLRFNLSHAHDLVVIALASGRRIGVDVEYVRPITDVEDIVRRFFSEKERTAFFALPVSMRLQAFFNGWTRKEAFAKAIGAGLGYPPDRFDVTLGAEASIEIHDKLEYGMSWSLVSFTPAPNYAAACVVEGTGCETQYYDWAWEKLALPNL